MVFAALNAPLLDCYNELYHERIVPAVGARICMTRPNLQAWGRIFFEMHECGRDYSRSVPARYIESGYTRSSLKVIIFERNMASHPMICTATGSTKEESMAIAARFFGVRDSCTMLPFAAIMA